MTFVGAKLHVCKASSSDNRLCPDASSSRGDSVLHNQRKPRVIGVSSCSPFIMASKLLHIIPKVVDCSGLFVYDYRKFFDKEEIGQGSFGSVVSWLCNYVLRLFGGGLRFVDFWGGNLQNEDPDLFPRYASFWCLLPKCKFRAC